MISKVLILILLINLAQSYFDVQMDRFEVLYQNTSFLDWSDLKVRKVNKTRSIVGDLKFFVPIGNEVLFQAKGYKKQGGEYRLMPYRLEPTPLCDFSIKDDYAYKDVAKGSEMPEDISKNCPIQPGTYKAHNVVFNLDKVPKTIIPSGDYAGEAIYEVDGKLILKYRVYATIVAVL